MGIFLEILRIVDVTRPTVLSEYLHSYAVCSAIGRAGPGSVQGAVS